MAPIIQGFSIESRDSAMFINHDGTDGLDGSSWVVEDIIRRRGEGIARVDRFRQRGQDELSHDDDCVDVILDPSDWYHVYVHEDLLHAIRLVRSEVQELELTRGNR